MNEIEREDARRVGRVIRAARKLRGLSQTKLSQGLQISQVTLSGLENGHSAISGSLWYRLSKLLNLDPDYSFFEGVIDSCDVADLNDPLETGYTIPKRYAKNAFSTVRTAQPFLRFFEACYGTQQLEVFMKERLGVDPDIRFIYNLRLSVRFNFDVAAFLMRARKFRIGDLDVLTRCLVKPTTHGLPARYFPEARDPIDLMKVLTKHIALYEQNFKYSIVNESRYGLDIKSIPTDFMRYFSYREDELPDFINLYRASFIRSFTKFLDLNHSVKVKVIPSGTKRKTECVFKITT